MLQSEIDEISQAFSDAWEEFFGQEMYYIPFQKDLTSAKKHPVYNEVKKSEKVYDYANKLSFYGTFKQEEIEEKGELAGRKEKELAEITFVTKELYDKGIKVIDARSLIEINHRDGRTISYNIVGHNGKVQLGDNNIFTKLKVVHLK